MGGPEATFEVEPNMRGVADAIAARVAKPGLHYVDFKGSTVPW